MAEFEVISEDIARQPGLYSIWFIKYVTECPGALRK